MVRYVVIVLLLSAAQASPIRPASTAPEPGKWTKAASMDTPRAYFRYDSNTFWDRVHQIFRLL